MAEIDEDRNLIKRAGSALNDRHLRGRWLYYCGDQPRIWVTSKLREMFRALADSMNENYCDLAVHARSTRLEITGWEGDGSQEAETIWTENRLDKRQADLYRWGLVYGHTYLMVEDAEDGKLLAPQRTTIVWHCNKNDDPTVVDYGVKYWWDGSIWRANVYDEDEVHRYVSKDGTARRRPSDPMSFHLDTEDEGGLHGFDAVPIVPVWPFGQDSPCLIDTIAPIQDRINKISANKFIAGEFGAFRQRVFFTEQNLPDSAIKATPDTAIKLDPGDPNNPARVQELAATDLSNYDDAKAAEIDGLFTLALLPRHLRIAGNSGEAPSGESITADEGPLVEALYDHHREFGAAVEDAMQLLGVKASPLWRDPITNNDMTQAATVRAYTDAGVPWQVAVKKYAGWTDEDIADATSALPAQQPSESVGGVGLVANPDQGGAQLLNDFGG